MALAPEVGHAGGHLTGRVVSKQRPLGQLHQSLCVLSTVSMCYICAVKNCGHNSARDKEKYRFFRFPAIIANQGEEIRELSERRRRQWFENEQSKLVGAENFANPAKVRLDGITKTYLRPISICASDTQ